MGPPGVQRVIEATALAVIGELLMLVASSALDREYSDPAATETSWEDTRKVLQTAELFWIGGPAGASQ
jgi:hypothetical protein